MGKLSVNVRLECKLAIGCDFQRNIYTETIFADLSNRCQNSYVHHTLLLTNFKTISHYNEAYSLELMCEA